MEPLDAADLQELGGYRLRARLGAGRVGLAYLGFSPAGRAAAVKVVHPDLAADPMFRARLYQVLATAQTVGGPYVAPLAAAGLEDDPPWLATLFVAGPSLADMVTSGGPLPAAAAWQLAAGMAEALREIHSRGIVHGDLKPSNVLLAVDGPRVADFWICGALDTAPVGAVPASTAAPSFLSPEQVDGGNTGPPSDVFSLGCLVAFATTGIEPFGDGPARLVMKRVLKAKPLLEAVPGQLRDLASACLAKRPAARPSLTELLAAVRADAPRGQDSHASFWPPDVAGLVRSYQDHLDAGLSAAADPARRRIMPDTAPRHWMPDAAHGTPHTTHGHAAPRRSRPRPGHRRFLAAAAAVTAGVLAVVAAVTAVTVIRAQQAGLVATLASPGRSLGGVSSVAFSPDGKTLAVGDDDGDVYLWDVATKRLTATLADPGSNGVNAVAFSPDGRTLAVADGDGSAYLWNVATARRTATLTIPASITGVSSSVLSVAFSPDGRAVAVGSNIPSGAATGSATYLWDVRTGHFITALNDPSGFSPGVLSVAFSTDGTMLAAGEGNAVIYLWNLATRRLTASLPDPSPRDYQNSVAFSPDGRTLASATGTSGVYLWDIATARRSVTLTYPGSGDLTGVAFSRDGRMLAGADANGSTYLWKLRPSPPAQSTVLTDPGAKGVKAVGFSPASSLMATAGGSSAYLWRVG